MGSYSAGSSYSLYSETTRDARAVTSSQGCYSLSTKQSVRVVARSVGRMHVTSLGDDLSTPKQQGASVERAYSG